MLTHRNLIANVMQVRDSRLYTGDIARVDEDGYVCVVDRMKDMVT